MNQSNEIWKPVPVEPFQDAYEVSSHGRVRSVDRTIIRKNGKPLRIKGQLMKHDFTRGYPYVPLSAKGTTRRVTVHSLVARAFLPAPPGPFSSARGGYQVNHIDGVKTNNHVSNLECVTGVDNMAHSNKLGLHDIRGVRHPKAKITDEDVRQIRMIYSKGARQVDLAHQFGLDQTTISKIVRRQIWQHVA